MIQNSRCFSYRIYPFLTFEFLYSCIRGSPAAAPSAQTERLVESSARDGAPLNPGRNGRLRCLFRGLITLTSPVIQSVQLVDAKPDKLESKLGASAMKRDSYTIRECTLYVHMY